MPKDPVCGKEIDVAAARTTTGTTRFGAAEVDPRQGTRSFFNGQWYYFCGLECRTKFLATPQTFLKQSGS